MNSTPSPSRSFGPIHLSPASRGEETPIAEAGSYSFTAPVIDET